MGAIPVDRRADGMLIVVLADYSLWVYEAASAITASATCIAPAAGAGRWLRIAVASTT